MKRFLIMVVAMAAIALPSQAQWVTFDPSNLAQSIINATKNIVQTSSTASNMINNFKETVKIYEQGKKYYDALKSVNNLVKDARKVQQTILMVGEISDIYVNNFQRMMRDKNYTVEELGAIAFGYTKLLEESAGLLNELKGIVNVSGLSMSDKERMDLINGIYVNVKDYRNLVNYYTNKNIAVSYLRSKKTGDTDRVMALYGNANDRYW
jgi:conjugal transfer/entry exclusion protein